MEVNVYKNKPLYVEGAFYDGTEACAEEFCKKWPEYFVLGVKKDNSFGDLFIQTGEGLILVAPGDTIFRNLDKGCFCSMDTESFEDYFDCITTNDCDIVEGCDHDCDCCVCDGTIGGTD